MECYPVVRRNAAGNLGIFPSGSMFSQALVFKNFMNEQAECLSVSPFMDIKCFGEIQ